MIFEQLTLGDSLPEKSPLVDLLREFLGGEGVMSGILQAFERMEIAEEEISRAKEIHPERSEEIHASFLLLQPSPILSGYPDEVYRAHCREILGRRASDPPGDPRWGTAAEVLAGLMEALMRAPLNEDGAALTWRMFKEVMPEVARGIEPPGFRESWPGALDELETQARRQIRVEERRSR
jgi:hypothetical protein